MGKAPTRRMLQVLAEYARTGSRDLAAERLGIRPGTVRTTLEELYVRLNVQSAIEAVQVVKWLTIPDDAALDALHAELVFRAALEEYTRG